MRAAEACLLGLLLGVLIASATRAAGPPTDDTPEVKKLLKQRVEVLRKAVDRSEVRFRAGQGTPVQILQAARSLLEAELELAEKPADRVAVYLAYFKLMCRVDDLVVSVYEAHHATLRDHYVVRAERIKAEIALRRAGGKPPADTKPPREVTPPREAKPPKDARPEEELDELAFQTKLNTLIAERDAAAEEAEDLEARARTEKSPQEKASQEKRAALKRNEQRSKTREVEAMRRTRRAAEGEAPTVAEEVKKRLVERRDLLRKAYKAQLSRYERELPLPAPAGLPGVIPPPTHQTLLLLLRHLREAELAAPVPPAERITGLTDVYRSVSKLDEIALLQYRKAGFASWGDCLQVRAERLAVEAALLQAGGKLPADVKPPAKIPDPGKPPKPGDRTPDKKETPKDKD